jgi:hypothetical protein
LWTDYEPLNDSIIVTAWIYPNPKAAPTDNQIVLGVQASGSDGAFALRLVPSVSGIAVDFLVKTGTIQNPREAVSQPEVLRADQGWTFVAGSYNIADHKVCMSVDAHQPLCNSDSALSSLIRPTMKAKFTIGCIANGDDPDPGPPKGRSQFIGTITRVTIYDSPVGDDEIYRAYSEGRKWVQSLPKQR